MALLVLLVLSGCGQSGYSKFYSDFSHKYGQLTETFDYLPTGQQPEVLVGSNLAQDSFSMQASGFVPIGYSSFQGRLENVDKALAQAKRIGATHLLLYSAANNVATLQIYKPTPVVLSNRPQPTADSISATAKHLGHGKGYLQAASYWVRRVQWAFGAYLEELPSALQQAGLATGCQLAIVVDGTPAAEAGLYSGDIVVRFNDKEIFDAEGFKTALNANQQAKILLSVYRDGSYLEKVVKLQDEKHKYASQVEL
jgi:membrane-associated protease RseP (regulator of RpoE activity)